MANAAALKAVPADSAEPPPRKKGKKGLVMIVALVLLLAGGGAGGYVYWQKSHAKDSKKGKDKVEEKAEETAPPQFVNIDQFVVNLNGGDHYLQTAMVLAVKSPEAVEKIKLYMPIIRNRILLLLSSQQADQLTNPETKVKLAEEILKQTRESLPPPKEGGDQEKGIKTVLFSTFIIQ
ncbi:MAG TPA: flagellar basal body-associated FliL family protein [Burkholderiales bacterium]|nr:flagellar basal body-associated FliL family protein [Burkholderiales bacterium]